MLLKPTSKAIVNTCLFDFPDDKAAWKIEDQYMFGPDLLVAPILYAGQSIRKVYLPTGIKWKNIWTGETSKGGCTVNADAPIEQIPLYVREGSQLKIMGSVKRK